MQTDRLILSRPTAADFQDFHEIHTDPAVYRHVENFQPRTLDESRQDLANLIAEWDAKGIGYYAVREAEGGPIIGFTGLMWYHRDGEDRLNLYYRYRPSVWSRGYALEAARAALDEIAGTPYAALRVFAKIRDNNPASRRLAERLGMRWDGVTYDERGQCVFLFPEKEH